jgi:hypothetical protein
VTQETAPATKCEAIANLVQELGYRTQIIDDLIHLGMSGWTVLLIPFDDESIQLYFGIQVDAEDGFGMKEANEFNRVHRFIKCYLTTNAVGFEQDFYFDLKKSDARKILETILTQWDYALGMVKNALDVASTKNVADAGGPTPPD